MVDDRGERAPTQHLARSLRLFGAGAGARHSVTSRRMSIDLTECLRRGAIGAFGAIPGTLAAHPFDVIKINQQVSGNAASAVLSSIGSVSRLYGGVQAGVAQKIATRGPMFLASELSTQTVQYSTGLERERALFVGSAMSGYATGFLAASFEWAKVQGGVRAVSSTTGSTVNPSRRMLIRHGAGLRNGLFDSTFFGCEHLMRNELGTPAAVSYGAAAALAVTIVSHATRLEPKRLQMAH